MDVKSKPIPEEFLDPDDAPELTEEFFEHATYRIGERIVTEKEFRAAADAIIREGKRKRRATSR